MFKIDSIISKLEKINSNIDNIKKYSDTPINYRNREIYISLDDFCFYIDGLVNSLKALNTKKIENDHFKIDFIVINDNIDKLNSVISRINFPNPLTNHIFDSMLPFLQNINNTVVKFSEESSRRLVFISEKDVDNNYIKDEKFEDIINSYYIEINSLHDKVKYSSDEMQLILNQYNEKYKIFDNMMSDLRIKMNQFENDSIESKTRIISLLSESENESINIKSVIDDLTKSKTEKDHLFNEFMEKRDEISSLLENANKVGLARSFSERKKELLWSGYAWILMFIIGISGLLFLGFCYILPILGQSSLDPIAVATRFLIGAPLIWLAWFGARQYAQNLRMREDYAFKEATAMAFVGYRNEMGQDIEMLKLLRESAIRNFSLNPLDAISKNVDVSSPIHDLLEKALSKLEPKQLIEAITALLKKDK